MMPAYSFQKQFVQMILNKSKTHTIRRRRKRQTKRGDMLMLYTGMRTKSCKLIVITRCVKVEPIEIIMKPNDRRIVSPIYISGKQFWKNWDVQEIHHLATCDGFVNIPDFFKFFEQYKQEVLEDFEIIHWDTDLMVVDGNGKAGQVRLQLGGDPHPALSLEGEENAEVCDAGSVCECHQVTKETHLREVL